LEHAEELLAGRSAGPAGQGEPDVIAVVDRLVGLGLVRALADASRQFFVFDAVRRIAVAEATRRGLPEATGPRLSEAARPSGAADPRH
jgi:hypothetical protein